MPAWACLSLLALAAASQADAPPANASSDEIIVTGERVPRTLRETSSSVAVVNEGEMEANGANRVDQILALIPNVQLGNGSQGPAIRGMDTTGPLYALPAFLGGNRPRMTLIVDGRPVSYNEFVFGTFPVWDANRIEVFRSPQTTTQGQNSIAGAIFVNTNDPSLSPEYGARAIVGSLKMRQVSALMSGSLAGDSVAFRVAGDLRYSRTSSKLEDVIEGGDPSHDVYGLLRAKLLVNPSPRTRMVLTYVHSESQMPQIVGVDAPFRKRRDDTVGYGVFRINVDSLTAGIRHEASNELAANLMLTAGDSVSRRLAIPDFGQTRNDGRDWSAEAVFNWSPKGPFALVAGASHSHIALKQFINLQLLSGSIGRFRDWQDGTGLFADATVELAPKVTMTAGVRYQRDRQKRKGALTATTFIVPIDFVGVFNAWLPKATLSYDVTPDFRIGAMVQKAYNPGGTTIRVDTLQPDEFKAERLWDYELFAKGKFAGGRGTAAVNIFYYDIWDAQRAEDIFVTTPSGRTAGFANLFNVPKARSYGAEAELSWRVTDSLSTRLAIGLLDTKIVRGEGESAVFHGNQFDRSPHFTGAAAVDWWATEKLRLSAQLRHHSPYFSDPQNSPALRIDSGTNVDARFEYEVGGLSIFGQVRNLFDTLNMLSVSSPITAEAEDPRTFSLGIEGRF
jgi:outer membrane receptor protein involved in Fe transport